MQALNEEGLQLEQHPGDAEIIRRVRRTVHTLKGDSAACGYRELSQLAHELDYVMTPELGKTAHASLADLVLSAADTFDAMLKACRGNAPIPSGDALRAYIRLLTHPVVTEHQAPLEQRKGATQAIGGFAWSEYEQVVIAKAASAGLKVLLVAIGIDENCPLRAAALQLVKNVLEEAGTILALKPDLASAETVNVIEAALATQHDHDWIVRKCQIPAVVSDIMVRPYQATPPPPAPQSEPAKPKEKTARKAAAQKGKTPAAKPASGTGPASALANVGISSEGLVPESKSPAQEPHAQPASKPAPAAESADSILRVDAERI